MSASSFTLVVDPVEVERAQDALRERLSRESGPPRPIALGFRGGQVKADVYWLPKVGIWFAPLPLETRWINAFGVDDPGGARNLPIVVQVSISHGPTRRTAGAFVCSDAGDLWLAHDGRVGGGKAGVNQTAFLAFLRQSPVDVEGTRLLLLGDVGSNDFPERLARFVRAAAEFKSSVGAESSATDGEEDETVTEPIATEPDAPSYWKLAPGRGGRHWAMWKRDGVVTIGWDELGDLSDLDRAEFVRRVDDQLRQHPNWNRHGIEQVWRVRNLRVGDRIVANVGTTRVVGIGTVTGPYHFVPTGEHRHRVPVRWHDLTERAVDKYGWRRTMVRLSKADFDEIVAARPASTDPQRVGELPSSAIDFDDILAALEDARLHFPTELVANVLLALQTKRFVILTGVSGTGKTRLALEIARRYSRETQVERALPVGAVDIVVRPYMLTYRRVVVPADLAETFLAEGNHGDGLSGRLDVQLPDGSRHSQAYYTRRDTKLLQVLFSGPVRDWFDSTLHEGDAVRLERLQLDSGAGVLRMSVPTEVERVTDARQYEVVPVRPDWTDRRGLLGFYNHLTEQYVVTPCLSLLLRATDEVAIAAAERRSPRPFFLILDEMNLARVEHYFSDFLSAIESGEDIELHEHALLEGGQTEQGIAIPRRLAVPSNVLFIGTVNVDETTYLFSPKVLDRAFTIEFNEVDLGGYGVQLDDEDGEGVPATDTLSLPGFGGTFDGVAPRPEHWSAFTEIEGGALRDVVVELNAILATENRHFGYRVANEIGRFVCLARDQGDGADAAKHGLDLALVQKVLPKLHGTQQELEPLLQALFAFAVTGARASAERAREAVSEWSLVGTTLSTSGQPSIAPRLPRFAAKVRRMLRRLEQQGFTSFIE